MDFKKTLNEAGAGTVTSVDFWSTKYGKQIVRFNGKNISLRDFLQRSSRDEEVKRVIDEIKKNKYYRGSVGDFILNLMKDNDGIIDIMVRKNGTYFDENEIKKNVNME